MVRWFPLKVSAPRLTNIIFVMRLFRWLEGRTKGRHSLLFNQHGGCALSQTRRLLLPGPKNPSPMKTKHVLLPAIAAFGLFACNPAPKEPAPVTPDASSVAPAPVDTVNNRYDRSEVKEIDRDTTKVVE